MVETPNVPVRNAFVRETVGADESIGESVKVFGEVDIANARRFEEEIRRAMASRTPVIVDLTQCRYFDSSGAHVIVEIARAEPGALRVIVPQGGAISRVFEILHVGRYIEIEHSPITTSAAG